MRLKEEEVMGTEERVTLETLAGGAAVELFQHQLDRVVQNILDPNMPAKAKRHVTLRLTIQPDEERGMGEAHVTCEAKLAGPRGASTMLYFGRKQGRAVAVENDPRQGGLFDAPGDKTIRAIDREVGK